MPRPKVYLCFQPAEVREVMSDATHTNECAGCGTSIATGSADGSMPCPQFGSTKRQIKWIPGDMHFTNHFLDSFVAHKLSLVTTIQLAFMGSSGAPHSDETRLIGPKTAEEFLTEAELLIRYCNALSHGALKN